eukprot:jgi/Pico_ML_1/55411/g1099.t1
MSAPTSPSADAEDGGEPSGFVGMDLFRHCRHLRGLGSAMVLLVLALVACNYYVTVCYGWRERMADEAAWNVALVVYHVLVGLLVWCYLATAHTDAGSVPHGWRPVEDVEAAMRAIERGEFDRADHSRPRYCRKCEAWKPERAHHCSVCNKCVLRMDHHCVWVANCVGAHNTKAFLLFLGYTAAACILSGGMLVPKFVRSLSGTVQEEDPTEIALVLFVFVLDAAFAISILGFLVMHVGLVAKNITTIEMYEKIRTIPWRYDKGKKKNFQEVFGRKKRYWMLPLYDREDKEKLVGYMLEMDKRPLLGSLPYHPQDV